MEMSVDRDDFEIIDADSTGTENLTFYAIAPLYADRTTTSASTQITIDIDFQNIFPGQTYTVDWELCTAQYDQCELYNEWDAMGGSDPVETEGSIGKAGNLCKIKLVNKDLKDYKEYYKDLSIMYLKNFGPAAFLLSVSYTHLTLPTKRIV